MLKFAIVISFAIVACCAASAQNLVPNPGFEIYNQCPDARGGIWFRPTYDSFPTVIDWINPLFNTSPDYYNTCATIASEASIPYSTYNGYHPAHNGNAYAGMSLFSGKVHDLHKDDWREYIETRLTEPLIAGHLYYVSYFFNYSYHLPQSYNIIAIDNNIGAHFSVDRTDTTFPSGANFYLSGDVNVAIPHGIFLSDTTDWVKIHGLYRATGGEQWLTMGFFDHDPISYRLLYSPVSSIDSISSVCYMLVDDVCVIDMQNAVTTDTTVSTIKFPVLLTGEDVHGEYFWNTTDTTPNIKASAPGTYWRQAWGDCSFRVDTFRVTEDLQQKTCIWFPTAFSPNNDGLNDRFGPDNYCNTHFVLYRFSVYNRWGQKIFETNNPDEKWDGTLKGQLQEEGTYFYQLQYLINAPAGFSKITNDNTSVIKGDVTLIR